MSNSSGQTVSAEQDFDSTELYREGRRWKSRLALWLLNRPTFMRLARLIRILPLGKRRQWVTRYDDVREVLAQPEIFRVPFRTKMQTLEPERCPFILGLDGGASYARPLEAIMRTFLLGDIGRIAGISAAAAEAALSRATTRPFDAISDLISAVPLKIYQDYYGLDTANSRFVLWLFAISNYTFRQIGEDDGARPAAVAAAREVVAAANMAIAEAKVTPKPGTVVQRLIDLQAKCPKLTDEILRTTFVGMTTGYVPVSTIAGCHILKFLLRRFRKGAMKQAVEAARANDDDLLARCLLEALRLYPINPGPWRICEEDYTFVSRGGLRRRIKKGTKVMVGTQSAMRDGRRVPRPGTFDPDRDASDSMVFGTGLHWCVGAPLAIAQMTQTFKPLLRRSPLRRAGKTRYFGATPDSLSVTFENQR